MNVYYLGIFQEKFYLKYIYKINKKIMRFTLLKNHKLNKHLDLYLNKKYNIFLIKTIFGLFYFYLPSNYFYKSNNKNISLLFHNKFFFQSFLSHFFTHYQNLNNIYIVRLKIRGLGYQIYRISNNLYSFHFHYINFFYLFMPNKIISYWYKKRMILISNNLWLLKTVFKCILLLKKLGPYRLLGIRYPRQIIILKKGGKSKLK
jgi:hypothetical protein